MRFNRIYFLFFFLFALSSLQAQPLTGTWEGDLGGDEFIQINVVQTEDKLCGYTWDYTYANKKNYCKAYFSGTHDKVKNTWFLEGTSFMENSGSHVLMQVKFKIRYEKGEPTMWGYCRITPSFLSPAETPVAISLKKVSDKPAMMTRAMKDCVEENEKELLPLPKPIIVPVDTVVTKLPVKKTAGKTLKKKSATGKIVSVPKKKPATPVKKIPAPPKVVVAPKKKTVIPKPVVIQKNKPVFQKSVAVKKIKDSSAPVRTAELPSAKTESVPLQTAGRTNKEISRIIVTEKKLTLNVYDNGTIDGDTVSIYYNGRLLISHRGLSADPIVIPLTLDENTTLHSIVLFAENLGSIPPNTALIICTTPSGKRYELYSSATKEQNAVLVFEYKGE